MSRPRRLLITTDAVGGVWQYAMNWRGARTASGHETILALLGPPPSDAQRRAVDGIQNGVTLVDTGLAARLAGARCGGGAAAGLAIARLASDWRVDVVQLNQPALAAGVASRCRSSSSRIAASRTWWERCAGTSSSPAEFAGRRRSSIAGWCRRLRSCAPSRAFASALGHAMAAVPAGCRSQRPHAARRDHRRAARFRLHRRPAVGRRQEHRDARIARRHDSDSRSRQPGRSRARMAQRVALAHLHPLGWSTNGCWPNTSRRVRSSSRRPVTSRSAWRCWRRRWRAARSSSSDIPTFRELWDGAAMFVDPGDATGFADDSGDALSAMCRSRLMHGDLARRRAARFTPRRMADGMDRLYARLLDQRAPPGGSGVRIAYFTHSIASCWNHGNAHFLRGVLRELIARGHDVRALEPIGNWSLANLLADHGEVGLAPWRAAYPELSSQASTLPSDPAALVGDAELVIVHEWNDAGAGGRDRRAAPGGRPFHPAVPRYASPRRQRSRGDPRIRPDRL